MLTFGNVLTRPRVVLLAHWMELLKWKASAADLQLSPTRLGFKQALRCGTPCRASGSNLSQCLAPQAVLWKRLQNSCHSWWMQGRHASATSLQRWRQLSRRLKISIPKSLNANRHAKCSGCALLNEVQPWATCSTVRNFCETAKKLKRWCITTWSTRGCLLSSCAWCGSSHTLNMNVA